MTPKPQFCNINSVKRLLHGTRGNMPRPCDLTFSGQGGGGSWPSDGATAMWFNGVSLPLITAAAFPHETKAMMHKHGDNFLKHLGEQQGGGTFVGRINGEGPSGFSKG